MLSTQGTVAIAALISLSLFFLFMAIYSLKKDWEVLRGRLDRVKELERRVEQLEAGSTSSSEEERAA